MHRARAVVLLGESNNLHANKERNRLICMLGNWFN